MAGALRLSLRIAGCRGAFLVSLERHGWIIATRAARLETTGTSGDRQGHDRASKSTTPGIHQIEARVSEIAHIESSDTLVSRVSCTAEKGL